MVLCFEVLDMSVRERLSSQADNEFFFESIHSLIEYMKYANEYSIQLTRFHASSFTTESVCSPSSQTFRFVQASSLR